MLYNAAKAMVGGGMPSDPQLRRVARISAWLLLAAVAISVVSGWGITRTEIVYRASFGLIDRGLANSIHRGMQVPMATFFLVHVLANVRIRLLARSKTVAIDVLLVALGVLLLIAVVYMESL